MTTALVRSAFIVSALWCAAAAQAAVGFALDVGQATVDGPGSDLVSQIEGDGTAYGARIIYGADLIDFELGYRRLPESTGQVAIACPGGCPAFPPVPVDALDAWSLAIAARPLDSIDRFSIVFGLALLKGGSDADDTEPMLGLRYAVIKREGFELALTAETMKSAKVFGLALGFGR